MTPFDPSKFAEVFGCILRRAYARVREKAACRRRRHRRRHRRRIELYISSSAAGLHAGSFPTRFRGSRVSFVNDNNREKHTIRASDDAARCATLQAAAPAVASVAAPSSTPPSSPPSSLPLSSSTSSSSLDERTRARAFVRSLARLLVRTYVRTLARLPVGWRARARVNGIRDRARRDHRLMFKWTHRPLSPKCRGMTS